MGGDYRTFSGHAHGELDPNDPNNAIITDIKLAPRNARGRVEYVATFSLIVPTVHTNVLIYSVVNRGTGSAAKASSRVPAGAVRARSAQP